MIYREYLVMRKALAWFAAVLAILLIVLWKVQGRSDYSGIDLMSGWIAAIFASIFGVALGNGSREAARVLWVLPMERWKLALRVVIVDLSGTTIAFALAHVGLRFSMKLMGTPRADDMLPALAMAYAAYGWSALAGMLGRRVPYFGIVALPALTIWWTVAALQDPLGALLRAPIVANPFPVFNAAVAIRAFTHENFPLDPVSTSLQWIGATWETPVLLAITVATCALAAFLWQRARVISL